MSRKLAELHPPFYIRVCELIAIAAERKIALMVLDCGRTQEEQAILYAKGRTTPGPKVTWTLNSKHVMKAPDFKSRAIDLCPYDVYQLHGDDKLKWKTEDPVWADLGEIGLSLGLKWGIVDLHGSRSDLGHFEWIG